MKKSISMITLLLLGMSALGAGLAQLTISISTDGPDYYADGTTVQTGEKYLLVYVSSGAVFAGIQSDGTLVDPAGNKIVTESLAIEGARCGFKALQYPPELYPAGGKFLIVLLDTRTAAGAVGGLVAQLGSSEAAGAASSDSTTLGAISLAATSGGAPVLVASAVAAAPAGTQKPVITSLKGAGNAVELKVGNVSASAVYEVQSTTDLSSGAWSPVAGGARLQLSAQGGGDEVPVTLQVPQDDKVRFFRVIVPGSN